jgi:hypothetical protein
MPRAIGAAGDWMRGRSSRLARFTRRSCCSNAALSVAMVRHIGRYFRHCEERREAAIR